MSVDEFYFSALYDEEDIFPISDEKYAEQIQLQEALMAPYMMTTTILIPGKEKKNLETGESSRTTNRQLPSVSFCEICMDTKPIQEMFRNNNTCAHMFCTECTASHVAAKLQENISMVRCPHPECRGMLDPLLCRSIIPEEVFGRWENALCENVVLGSQKFYCPFKDCSAMMVDEGGDGEVVTSSECPNCNRLFCAQCKVGWHAGVECGEFQRLKKGEREKEDLMLMELAKNKRWRRCPQCRFYVEKNQGCHHISCRCGYQFCYGCGSHWDQLHHC
ncbi:E3 ubiquitin-protein ligase RNF144A [Senna tora]|uniref:RBR-type E3 ubiquitin transferase n=1 Tax=Senna tora TaxID=362788 RepID=A0A834TBM5_9FABA|nr:E3 ubiquitin-protein ligase RNF144A [Senna tora]